MLKATTFRADEVLFRATSPGGTSLASDKDYIPAETASQVITAGGVGKFSVIDLRKMLTGKVASASPFIGELEEGLTGSSSRKDLETMFQLIYLRFTQPRADPTAFTVQATQTKTFLANQTVVPEFAFFNALTTTQYQNHLRRRLSTLATVDEWNLQKSLEFYKDRFADASDFTFFFVGSFDMETMKPLVERYLGALPSIHRKENWKDVGVRTPTGVVEEGREGNGTKSQTGSCLVVRLSSTSPPAAIRRCRRYCRRDCSRPLERNWRHLQYRQSRLPKIPNPGIPSRYSLGVLRTDGSLGQARFRRIGSFRQMGRPRSN